MSERVVYITRRITFCASHRLHCDFLSSQENEQLFGKCGNPNGHGHNFVMYVTLRGVADPKTGIIINLRELNSIVDEVIVEKVDHKNLNLDVSEFKELNPTVENMVVVFWNLLSDKLPYGLLHEVKLEQSEDNSAIYRGE